MVYSGIQLQRRFACLAFWWVLSAIFDPNFFSQSRQGSSKWYLRLWVLKSPLFWNILSQFLQEYVIWSILCMFALCSLKRSGVTNVFPHTMHKLSRAMQWNDEKLEAHKVILAALSPFLQPQIHSCSLKSILEIYLVFILRFILISCQQVDTKDLKWIQGIIMPLYLLPGL